MRPFPAFEEATSPRIVCLLHLPISIIPLLLPLLFPLPPCLPLSLSYLISCPFFWLVASTEDQFFDLLSPAGVAMRFNAAFASALVSSASLLGYAHAEESEKVADSTSSLANKPTFTVCRSSPDTRSWVAVASPHC